MNMITKNNRILLILPCTNKKPYSISPTWRYVYEHLKPWCEYIDFAAIDCITNPQTGRPFGIVPMSEEDKVVGLDERPDPSKLEPLITSIKERLHSIENRHHAIAYINVKIYWQALTKVSNEFDIHMLPSVYQHAQSWSVDVIGASPPGVFRKYINELVEDVRALF